MEKFNYINCERNEEKIHLQLQKFIKKGMFQTEIREKNVFFLQGLTASYQEELKPLFQSLNICYISANDYSQPVFS